MLAAKIGSLLLSALLFSATPGDDVITLKATSYTKLPMPGFGFVDSAQCDDSGNMYFLTDHLQQTRVLKVAPDGSKYEFFNDKVDEPFRHIGFRASFDGSISNLYQTERSMFVSTLRDAQSKPTRTRLEVPDHLYPQQFAVFNSGAVLLSGHFEKNAGSKLAGKSYLAIFGPDGKLRRKLKNAGSKEDPDAKDVLPEGFASVAADGRAYWLGHSELYTITEFGDVQRVKLQAPEAYRADQLFVTEGYAVVSFVKARERKPLDVLYALLSPSTGDVMRWYKPSEELGNNLVCFDKARGLTFYRVEGRVKLIHASIQ